MSRWKPKPMKVRITNKSWREPLMNYYMKVDDGVVVCSIRQKPQNITERKTIEDKAKKEYMKEMASKEEVIE